MQISYERSAKSIRTEQPLDEDGLEDIAIECRGIPNNSTSVARQTRPRFEVCPPLRWIWT